ncbi:MAG TPA: acetate kinase [Kineosporiaceae bacterium]|nr:acetate kinase [Kineosporiaceae bacterium]
MRRTVLVLNAGSSSVKYRLLDPATGERLADGTVERVQDAGDAVRQVVKDLGNALRDAGEVAAVGHRVVHGGDRFTAPTVVDDDVLAAVDELADLAPLHNPAAAAGIRAAREALPGVPQVAVFDTAFHATLPLAARTYAVPREWRERYGVRRYGFHGTNFAHVTTEAARLLGREPGEVNLVALHLGNGASACAIRGGTSVDTSMGLTPLAGLVMGTRSGDLDPSVPGYLARVAGLGPEQVDDALEHASGLEGLAGVSDMRDLLQRRADGDPDAALAFDVYCHRVRSYVGAYLAVLGRVDAVVFTGGVGEHTAPVRAASLAGLEGFGIVLDADRNEAEGGGARRLGPDDAPVAVLVVPADEELEIGRQALAAVTQQEGGHG